MLVDNIFTPTQRAAMDSDTLAEIERQLQLRAWEEAERQSNHSAPLAPPEGLSAVERMKWARQHGQVVPEFTLPEQSAPVVVPPNVLAMNPTDRMRWVRAQQRAGE